MTAIPIMSLFLEADSETTWNDSYTYYGYMSWWGQRSYLKWQLYQLWPYFLRRTAKLPEMTAIPIMAICRWGQRSYLEWQLYQLWPYFLRKTAKVPEMTVIPIKAMFPEESSETTWNDSYTFYSLFSWGGQRNYLKWQLYLLRPCFFRGTAKLP